jgi:hypothetical protein
MLRKVLLYLPALALAATLAGCATTRMTAEWKDPAYAGASLKGKRVLVACRAPDDAMRRLCEDQWANQLGAQGIVVVRSYTVAGFTPGGTDNPDEMRAAGRRSDTAVVATVSLQPSDVTLVNPGPQVGVGMGGGSGGGYRGGGFGFGGVGVSFPIGGATATQRLAASTSLVDVASGKLFWSGNATTPSSADQGGQVSALAQKTIESLRSAGVL